MMITTDFVILLFSNMSSVCRIPSFYFANDKSPDKPFILYMPLHTENENKNQRDYRIGEIEKKYSRFFFFGRIHSIVINGMKISRK